MTAAEVKALLVQDRQANCEVSLRACLQCDYCKQYTAAIECISTLESANAAMEADLARAKGDALQDLAYYNGARQCLVIATESVDAAKKWVHEGCGGRKTQARNALASKEVL